MKKAWLLLLVLAIGVAAWWFTRPKPLQVEMVAVSRGEVVETVVNTRAGTVKSCHRSKLALPLGGVVAQLWVHEGDRVSKGDKLLELWNKDIHASVIQAQADLAHSALLRKQSCLQAEFEQRESKRQQVLKQQNVASETSADQAQTRASSSALACEAAQVAEQMSAAQLQLIQARLEQTQLHAPFAGVIAEVNGELGEYLTPSPPGVMTPSAIDLLDDQCFYVSAPIDEVDAAKVALNMPVVVTLDALPNQKFSAWVRRIAPYVLDLEKQARTVEVEVELAKVRPQISLLIGYSADLEIELARADETLRIPSEAVLREGLVYRFNGKQLELVQLKLGLRNWNWVEVKHGLTEGDTVVHYPGKLDYEPGQWVTTADGEPASD